MAATTRSLMALGALTLLLLLLLGALRPARGQAVQATCDVCAADGWFPVSGAAAGDNCQTQYCVCYAPYTDADAAGASNAWLYSCPSSTCFDQTTKKCTVCQACCAAAAGCP